jgi:CheY-like chemotaxis protein
MLHRPNSIIIVEDQPLIACMLEDLAASLGWEVVATAYSADAALTALDHVAPTLAVLDIDLGDSTSLGVAALCDTLNIPVVFVTGYAPGQVPPECGDAPVLSKPFSEEQFADALRQAVVERLRHH